MQSLIYKIYPIDRNLNQKWFIEFVHPVTRKKFKRYGNFNKFSTVREKLAESQRVLQEIHEELKIAPVEKANLFPGLNIPDLIMRKFEERVLYLRPKSASTYQTKVLEFVRWYRLNAHKKQVADLGIGVAFIKHLKETKQNNTTINSYRCTIKSMFTSLKKIIPENPFEDVQKLKERRKSFMYFDEDMQVELRKIIAEEDSELWLACQCQYYLLLRPNELRTIKIGSFNLRTSNLRVEGEISKNSFTQTVMIPDEFIKQLSFIDRYPPDFYLFGKDGVPGKIPHSKKLFPQRHQDLLKRHKYNTRDYKFYSWKHTGAVMYYLATGDVKGLKEQGRWHSLDMVNEYLKNLGVMDIDRVRFNFPKIGSQVLRPGS